MPHFRQNQGWGSVQGVKGKGFIPSVENSEYPCREVLTVGVLTFGLCSDTC